MYKVVSSLKQFIPLDGTIIFISTLESWGNILKNTTED